MPRSHGKGSDCRDGLQEDTCCLLGLDPEGPEARTAADGKCPLSAEEKRRLLDENAPRVVNCLEVIAQNDLPMLRVLSPCLGQREVRECQKF